jgi:acetyl-CoA carboxylase biotin carboxyl carrier protein
MRVAETGESELEEVFRSVLALVSAVNAPKRVRVRRGDLVVDLELQPPTAGPDAVCDGAVAAARDRAVDQSAAEPGLQYVCAPIVGTFYHAPEPGARPFVSPGDVVEPGQRVGIIESMKMMNPIEAETAGVVVEILVANGTPVEYDERLIAIRARDSGAGEPS